MKPISIALAGIGLALAAVPASAQAQNWQPLAARQANVEARINQGIRSGALTRPEAQRLRADYRQLIQLERRYRQSGGRFTVAERRDLDQRYNMLSRRIAVQKRDRQVRGYR